MDDINLTENSVNFVNVQTVYGQTRSYLYYSFSGFRVDSLKFWTNLQMQEPQN